MTAQGIRSLRPRIAAGLSINAGPAEPVRPTARRGRRFPPPRLALNLIIKDPIAEKVQEIKRRLSIILPLEDPIADGNTSDIYTVVEEGQKYCVKVIKKPNYLELLEHEALLLDKIATDSLVKSHGLVVCSLKGFETVGLKLEFIQGVTLNKIDPMILKDHQVDILQGLCKILLELEKNKILHNDLHLGNFIYNPQSRILKLIDFGLAYKTDENDPPDTVLFAPGILEYKTTPEGLQSLKRTSANMFSAAVAVHKLFTQRTPYKNPRILGLLKETPGLANEARELLISSLFRPVQKEHEYAQDSLVIEEDLIDETLHPIVRRFLTQASMYDPNKRLTPIDFEQWEF